MIKYMLHRQLVWPLLVDFGLLVEAIWQIKITTTKNTIDKKSNKILLSHFMFYFIHLLNTFKIRSIFRINKK